jgi:hypothetical protein
MLLGASVLIALRDFNGEHFEDLDIMGTDIADPDIRVSGIDDPDIADTGVADLNFRVADPDMIDSDFKGLPRLSR